MRRVDTGVGGDFITGGGLYDGGMCECRMGAGMDRSLSRYECGSVVSAFSDTSKPRFYSSNQTSRLTRILHM